MIEGQRWRVGVSRLGLGPDEVIKDRERTLPDRIGQLTVRDVGAQVCCAPAVFFVSVFMIVLVGVIGVGMDLCRLELSGVRVLIVGVDGTHMYSKMNTSAFSVRLALEVEMKRAEAHLGQFPLERRGLDAEVAKEADDHVAAEIAGRFEK